MLPIRKEGSVGPWIVLLHWLGGSARTWDGVTPALVRHGYRVACIDLPGFGETAGRGGCGVEEMSREVVETIRALEIGADSTPAAWLLGGHSMGGKIATVVAHLASAGEPGLAGLKGLLLVSPSPPGPEPMPGGKREQLLAGFGTPTGDTDKDRAEARSFLSDNIGRMPLSAAVRELAEDDLLRLNRAAFHFWLTDGSREDWADWVGTLRLPALVMAGSEDGALGPEAQRQHLLPHLSSSELVTLEGAGHLAPLERPAEVALRTLEFAGRLGLASKAQRAQPDEAFQALMQGELTSPQTRAAMEARLRIPADAGVAQALSREDALRLRSLVECLVPGAPVNLAARLEDQLALGKGDGWRYATLPEDRAAWMKGLHSLHYAAKKEYGVPFVALWPEQQVALLQKASSGDIGRGFAGVLQLGQGAQVYSGSQMKQWFEEVRGEVASLYMSDPRVMDRVGFTGFADQVGFTRIRLGEREGFER